MLGVAVAALAGLALAQSPAPSASPRASTTIAEDAFAYTPAPMPPQRQLPEVLPRLEEADRDFTIVVFGDSTGVSAKGWQVLVPEWLGEQYDREVVLHPWDRDATRYNQQWILADGNNAPITVWNASSPGRDVAFAREHESTMVPIDPALVDIVFVNFGHTEKPDVAVSNVDGVMKEAAEQYPNAAIVYLKQNPDHSKSPLRETQQSNVYYLEKWANHNNFETIPVYDAIDATGRVDELMDEPTLIHPNDAGYRVWADTMIERLKTDGAQ